MKRFKAAVIGGTGYGGAEMIRRLLIHPDVELVRVVAVDHVGERHGRIDVLVNNAGITKDGLMLRMDDEDGIGRLGGSALSRGG